MKIKKLSLLCFATLLLTSCGTKQEDEIKQEEIVRPDSFMLSTDNYDFYFEDLDSDIIKEETIKGNVSELERFIRTNFTKQEESPLEFKAVIKDINNKKYEHAKKNREDSRKHSIDEWYGSEAYRSLGSELLTQTEFDMMRIKNFSRGPHIINKSEAREDAILLDKLFRSFYGPYKQFGRENFNKALEENLAYIDNYEDNNLINNDFEFQMYKSYHFIRDIHTQVNDGRRFEDTSRLKETGYYFDDYYFMKDDKGYYLKDYSPKVYLTSVNEDSNLDDYLHYGITQEGELAYIISFYDLESKGNHNVSIILADKTFEIEVKQMNAIDAYRKMTDRGLRRNDNFDKEISSITLVDGYPVVAMRTYSRRDEGIAHFPTYFKAGNELKNDKVVIHDTRSNTGGSTANLNPFYAKLTRHDYQNFWQTNTSGTKQDLYGIDVYKSAYARDFVIEGYDNLLFTLTDNASGSCGDQTVDYTKAYVNGIVVGEPTEGAMLGGNNIEFQLPHSKFYIYMTPRNKIAYSFDTYPDGIGIDPDIWVNSEEALDKLVKCLEYYDIKPSPNSKEVVERIGYGTNDMGRVDLSIKKEEVPLEYNYVYKIEEVTDDGTYFQVKACKYLKDEEEPVDSKYFTISDINRNSTDDFITKEIRLFGTNLNIKIYKK